MIFTVKNTLTFAGSLPFIAGAAAMWSGTPAAQEIGEVMLTSYGLLILSFVAGTHWGYLAREGTDDNFRARRLLLISSNMIALMAWCFYLMLDPMLMLPLFALLFLALLITDYLLKLKEIVPARYYTMRRGVTMVVVIALAMASVDSTSEGRKDVAEIESQPVPNIIQPRATPPKWYKKAAPSQEGTI